ncbi:hypothetical protein K438DRAFT_1940777 [Mycena galopus ATCC 62051]|nr:hypothetical protein K438DRAFT_1940777 [Mycena galopus ATCC 62051]
MLVLRDGGQPTSAICGHATLRANREGSGGDGGERVRLRTPALAETGRCLPLKAPRKGSGGVLRTPALADKGACPTSKAADTGTCGERRCLADTCEEGKRKRPGARSISRTEGGASESGLCMRRSQGEGGAHEVGGEPATLRGGAAALARSRCACGSSGRTGACGHATLRAARDGSGGKGRGAGALAGVLAGAGGRLPLSLRAPWEGSGGVLGTPMLADAGACSTSKPADAGTWGERGRLADAREEGTRKRPNTRKGEGGAHEVGGEPATLRGGAAGISKGMSAETLLRQKATGGGAGGREDQSRGVGA